MKNNIFNENNLVTMSKLSDSSISGIITSPPYNITSKRKDIYYNNGYSDIDGLTEEEYLRVRVNEFMQFSRILEDTGVICYNISYHNENPILPTLLMAKIHNSKKRMPTILEADTANAWLNENLNSAQIEELAKYQLAESKMSAYTVAKNFLQSSNPCEKMEYKIFTPQTLF